MSRIAQSLFVVVGLALACPAPRASAQFEASAHFPDEYQQGMVEATVRVHVRVKKGWQRGTAVCIATNRKYAYLLSCAHLVEGAKEMHFEVFTRKSYPKAYRYYKPAWRAWWNTKDDIALIRAPIYVPKKINLCPHGTMLSPDVPLLSVGCGRGAPPVCQVAKLIGLDEAGDYAFDRGSIFGRSGSAVVTRQHGVIGIHITGRPGVSYAVHYSKIHAFLASNGFRKLIPAKPLAWEMTDDERAVLTLLNEARAEKKLPPLAPDPVLFEAARIHATNMIRQDQMTRPIYSAAWSAFHHEGLIQPKRAQEAWMALPVTRDNVLNQSFRAVGVGLGRSTRGKSYYSLVFSASRR
jgi:uncharacterized protein YkwD